MGKMLTIIISLQEVQLMSLVKARGEQAKDAPKKVDLKKVYLKLKENQGHKVRLLGTKDYIYYDAHGAYDVGIYNQPCIAPLGKVCPLCVAHAHGGDKFDGLYLKERYVFAFASLETGELVALDVSKGQGKKLISDIEEYRSVVEDGDVIGFTLKRTGTKSETSYSLNPILKMTAEDKEAFAKFDGKVVEDEFFDMVLQPRSEQLQAKILKEAGFDVETYLPHIKLEDENTEPDTDAQPIDENGSDDDLLSHI
jgi:hypothetical protein